MYQGWLRPRMPTHHPAASGTKTLLSDANWYRFGLEQWMLFAISMYKTLWLVHRTLQQQGSRLNSGLLNKKTWKSPCGRIRPRRWCRGAFFCNKPFRNPFGRNEGTHCNAYWSLLFDG